MTDGSKLMAQGALPGGWTARLIHATADRTQLRGLEVVFGEGKADGLGAALVCLGVPGHVGVVRDLLDDGRGPAPVGALHVDPLPHLVRVRRRAGAQGVGRPVHVLLGPVQHVVEREGPVAPARADPVQVGLRDEMCPHRSTVCLLPVIFGCGGGCAGMRFHWSRKSGTPAPAGPDKRRSGILPLGAF